MANINYLVIILCLLSVVFAVEEHGDPKEHSRREGKICIGTNGRMSVPNNREHHYRNLRDRYTNCTYVDGNLELTWLQDENLDLSFLQHIREVTGYVLISHVDVTRIVLPSLQIIRGRTLFKLNVHDDEFALLVTLSKMHNLELPALRDILEGSVGILNNYNLCHIKTIEWKEIITGTDAKLLYHYKFNEPERDCTPCHESCTAGCWGEGAHNCQKFSKVNCSPQCHQGRCFGPKPRECCHLFCAGGCTGPKQSDCLACRNFYDDGVCKQECPPMQRYNPIKYRWEKNPEGKYAYGATCVKDCPKHLLKDNGACVRSCPPKKKAENGECVPCDGPCPKTCIFSDTLHAGNIDSLQNCTIIEGSITILDSSFNGFQQIYENFTFGPRYPALDPVKLEVLSTIKEVTGFLNIQAQHPKFKTLSAFRNLEVVGGRTLTEYFASLYIVKTSLTSLDFRSLRKIRSGNVAILENNELCFAQDVSWSKIMKSSSHNTLLQNNKSPERCHQEGHVCDDQCSAEGCWGPGNRLCLSCKTFQVGFECVLSCDPAMGLYRAGERECMKCDKECEGTCSGPAADHCLKCKNTKDGPFCVEKCPDGKYDNRTLGECMPCHDNCVGGCNGPENNVGPNGCNSCDKAVINSELDVNRCLQDKEVCPDGTFYEYVAPQVQAKLKALAGKAICRPCHPLCKRCNGYGFHQDVCQECVGFVQEEQCTTECSNDFYSSTATKECLPCSSECRGCTGPTAAQCHSCKNYKILAYGGDPSDNTTAFNCTKTCPADFPHKLFPEDGSDPYCSMEPTHLGQPLIATGLSYPGLVGIIVATVIVISVLLVVSCYYWKQRAKAKENTAKMTMVMTGYGDNEPLQPTNIKPNLAKLNIVKEHELRRGGILGYGAFGTVYKGVWVPEGKNVKIPVAVKELKEGTDKNANQQILDEAYIMASVEHPHLLQLLAVCMTSRLMLVTQLMPLGCLLEYVRNNKDKIGSKPLLNWCRQIASGMAYLEEKRLVHRDLAARNVLVQTPNSVKITDFGLAKLLDINEDEYKAQGGKMPIKWLALECIQHRVFTHKSDVWAFGVTVWELLTYGEKPYENVHPREMPDLLEKGERLSQPPICTIDVYMILIKCWMVEADNRPSFKWLAEEFGKMARDPGRYLVILGDKLMRLPSYTTQDEKVLIRNLSSTIGGSEIAITAEEYLNPARIPSQHTLNTPVDTPQPSTPTQKFFPPNMPPPSYNDTLRTSVIMGGPAHRQSRYCSTIGINDGFSTLGSRNMRHSNFSNSCDPLKYNEDDQCDGMVNHMPNGTIHSQKSHHRNSTMGPRPPGTVNGLSLDLPVDDEDYLMPSPQSPFQVTSHGSHSNNNNHVSNAYMDLISDPKGSSNMFQYPPPQNYFLTDYPSNYGRVPDPHMHTGGFSMDNPEYILNEQRRCGDYHTLGIPIVHSSSPSSHSQGPSSIHSVHSNGMQPQAGGPYPSLSSNGSTVPPPAGLNGVINSRLNINLGHLGVQRRSSGEESDEHEYYNDLERLKREMQPLQQQQQQLAPTSPPQSASSAGSVANSVRSTGVGTTAQLPQPSQPFKLLPPPASKHETTV